MRGPAYEHAANLLRQIEGLPWWSVKRWLIGRRIERVWKEEA